MREEWYDPLNKVAVTIVDVKDAAQELAKAHLSGPTAAKYLAEALAGAALLGAEMSEKDESVSVQMKCSGPLGGLNVECTSEGTLRGYTEKKILDDFDGVRVPKDKEVLGDVQLQITRTVPGRILSQGISRSFDGYLAGSLQRKACIKLEASVSDDVEILGAKGVMVEDMPDHVGELVSCKLSKLKSLNVSSRRLLDELGLKGAELKKTTELKFACRCSPERAVAMLGALSDVEKASLPEKLDITCHMCGRIFTVKTR